MVNKKIYFYTKYYTNSASVRERFITYRDYLKKNKYQVVIRPLISNSLFKKRIIQGISFSPQILISLIKRIFQILFSKKNLLIIQYELIPFFPAILERFLKFKGIPYLIDIDDAIFHNYDSSNNKITKILFKKKYNVIFKNCHSVLSGNLYLKKKSLEFGAKKTFLFPTTVNNKTLKYKKNKKFTVVWIGSPSTTKYLNDLSKEIDILSSFYDVKFRIIGSKDCLLKKNKNIEFLDWSINKENKYISQCHVGIMPLRNTKWEKGKCGYKLLMYMKHRLPVIASPVGANLNIINNGREGFFAKKKKDWIKYILKLKNNNKLSQKLGNNGKKKILKNYTKNIYYKKFNKIINEIKI
mgnify:CR=1 FL=1